MYTENVSIKMVGFSNGEKYWIVEYENTKLDLYKIIGFGFTIDKAIDDAKHNVKNGYLFSILNRDRILELIDSEYKRVIDALGKTFLPKTS